MKAKGQSGQYLCTVPPYGYIKDPEDKNKWVVDEEAAEVVREIYQLCMEGNGPSQIARIMTEHGVLIPSAHWQKMGLKTANTVSETRCEWVADTVSEILAKKEYLGHMVNFKTYRDSYKSKKKRATPEEDQLVFENVHEAIIEQDMWDTVQELRKNKRRPTRTGKTNMFSGLAVCADCGSKLYYCTSNKFEKRQDHFVCSKSRKPVDPCTTHFIRAVVLEEMVLMHIRFVLDYVRNYEDSFRATLGANRTKGRKQQLAANRKQMTQAQKRVEELDSLFVHLYEDNVSGKLTDERFAMLSTKYDAEQKDLREQIAMLENEIETQEQQTTQVEDFVAKCRKYSDPQELTPAMLNDLVGKVLVHAPDKSSGRRVKEIEVSYNLVGVLPPLRRFTPLAVECSEMQEETA